MELTREEGGIMKKLFVLFLLGVALVIFSVSAGCRTLDSNGHPGNHQWDSIANSV